MKSLTKCRLQFKEMILMIYWRSKKQPFMKIHYNPTIPMNHLRMIMKLTCNSYHLGICAILIITVVK